ncbi:O-GlcNAcase [Candidatus Phycosocius bacilliformis]|uniref:O-GlcNAcase n=1 Tax=Candidatus Phycosocius bacilliformis TaxID=1445552 RepID=A0A2P2E627_9PROT|nr:beta-N-acetylglucosaminidase domain-containing protein [Candidatus Phycosocius bacilliformis]GBF56511.1 O-GlcNAcase [Candidatus Phycosocius bacilliformis]
MSKVNLGIVEGYFGQPWSWDDRRAVVEILAQHGYRFFHYAPKGDPHLRRRWIEPHPLQEAGQIAQFVNFCKGLGVRVGVGLSPYEAFNDFNDHVRHVFQHRLEDLASLGVQELGIFFDDMHSTLPDLAERQVDIMHLARDTVPHLKLIMTPTYYTNDPVLDRVFGRRPPTYLSDLGTHLDPAIDVYWTGEEVCSREYSLGHLRDVGKILKRKPLLWDNYPVNDGPRMSQFLHVRAFTGRPHQMGDWLAGHAVNPALQPFLTCLPAITLAMSYAQGEDYCYGASTHAAAIQLLGTELAEMVRADLMSLQDVGLAKLGNRRQTLLERYSQVDHPAAREIVAWLQGEYAISTEMVQTQ